MQTCHVIRALVRLTQPFLCVCLLAFGMHALAGPAEPPLELLYSSDSRLISGELIEINPAGRLIFKREKVFGESVGVPELVDIAVNTRALERAKIGEHYIVGYTNFRFDKQYPQGIAPAQKRTSMISSSGLDPAFFLDEPELRRILQLASTEHGRESSTLRKLLLKSFAEDAPALQSLAAGQFWLDTGMSAKLNEKEKSILQRAAVNEQVDPATRSLLITAAADRPADFGPWAPNAINNVLEITPVDGYSNGAADPAELILLAFDEAAALKVEVPFENVARWLRSSHLAYVERASSMLEALYPERRRAAYEDALGNTGSSPDIQRFLEGKLQHVD